ncbi:MAG: FCD domain-containing protein [Luteitalea sp.]|nr:FCD domain-containing protein [Luteitalea sp.]
MTSLPLQPLKTGSLSTQVFETLRTAIFAGQFQPGDPLRELHLARDLNVSQATIREALVQLERLGLVVRTPNVGTQVTKLSRQDIAERVELRTILEERALAQAAARMDAAQFTELGRRLGQLTTAMARNDYFEAAQADLAFHRYIWERSGNHTLYRTLDQLAVPLFAFASIVRGATQQHLDDLVRSHEGLVSALRQNNVQAIRTALRRHFQHGLSEVEIHRLTSAAARLRRPRRGRPATKSNRGK